MSQTHYYTYKRLRLDQDGMPFIDKDRIAAFHNASCSIHDVVGFEDGAFKTGILVIADERVPTVETRLVHERRLTELESKINEDIKLTGEE